MATVQDVNANIISLLECPVCLEIGVPPIYQCKNGHVICNACHGKIKECGICRVQLTSDGIRNLALEKLAEDAEMPCKHSSDGCPLKLKLNQLASHSLDCPFGESKFCLALISSEEPDCLLVKNCEIAAHLIEHHDAILVDANCDTIILQKCKVISTETETLFPPICMLLDDKVFVVKTTVLGFDSVVWRIILVGSSQMANNFVGSITLHGPTINNHSPKLKWSGLISGIDSNANSMDASYIFEIPRETLQAYFQSDNFESWKVTVEILHSQAAQGEMTNYENWSTVEQTSSITPNCYSTIGIDENINIHVGGHNLRWL